MGIGSRFDTGNRVSRNHPSPSATTRAPFRSATADSPDRRRTVAAGIITGAPGCWPNRKYPV